MKEDENWQLLERGSVNGCISGCMCLLSGAIIGVMSMGFLVWKPSGIAQILLRAALASTFQTCAVLGLVGAIWGFFNPKWLTNFTKNNRRVLRAIAGIFLLFALLALLSPWWFPPQQ
jgi:hypothetical protein